MEVDINVPINNDLEKRVAEVFSIFDHLGNKVIDHRDVGMILRLLGCCPSLNDIQEIINATQFIEFKGNIHLAKFLAYVCPMITRKRMKPASDNTLLKAFEFLDPDGLGYLEKDYFIDLMSKEGEPLTKEELNESLLAAVDPVTGVISYEYYINQLAYKPENSIYDIAARVEEERKAAMPQRKSAQFRFQEIDK